MGVVTEADRLIDRARNGVNEAVKALAAFVAGDAWGYEEYSDEYKQTTREVFMALLEAKDKLK